MWKYAIIYIILNLCMLVDISQCTCQTLRYPTQQLKPNSECTFLTVPLEGYCTSLKTAIQHRTFTPCTTSNDCDLQEYLTCAGNQCRLLKFNGDSCDGGVECMSQFCKKGKCAFGELGDKCVDEGMGEVFKTCGDGLYCGVNGVCLWKGGVDQPCIDHVGCKDGLYCDKKNGETVGFCLKPLSRGDQCHAGGGAPCQRGLFCHKKQLQDPFCDAQVGIGGYCESDGWCRDSDIAETECRAYRCEKKSFQGLGREGDVCFQSSDCHHSFSCIAGQCQKELVNCYSDEMCVGPNQMDSPGCLCNIPSNEKNGTCGLGNCGYLLNEALRCGANHSPYSYKNFYGLLYLPDCCHVHKKLIDCQKNVAKRQYPGQEIPFGDDLACPVGFYPGTVIGLSVGLTLGSLIALCACVICLICVSVGSCFLFRHLMKSSKKENIQDSEKTGLIPPTNNPPIDSEQGQDYSSLP